MQTSEWHWMYTWHQAGKGWVMENSSTLDYLHKDGRFTAVILSVESLSLLLLKTELRYGVFKDIFLSTSPAVGPTKGISEILRWGNGLVRNRLAGQWLAQSNALRTRNSDAPGPNITVPHCTPPSVIHWRLDEIVQKHHYLKSRTHRFKPATSQPDNPQQAQCHVHLFSKASSLDLPNTRETHEKPTLVTGIFFV